MTSATERFKNRVRPEVSPRTEDISISLQQPHAKTQVYSEPLAVSVSSKSAMGSVQDLQDELDSLPKVSNFMLRVEEQYKAQIQHLAEQEGLTPETLLQGLWVVVQNQPQIIQQSISEGRKHHKRRQRAAELKVALTRVSKVLGKI